MTTEDNRLASIIYLNEMIGSESKSIEVYRREAAFWKQYDYQEGDTIELTSLGVRFSFERVYRGIRIL